MLAIEIAVLAIVAAAAPHLLPQPSIPPVLGVWMWFTALLLRAGLVIGAVAVILFVAPSTWQFAALSDWCLHTVVPYLSAHLGVDGHAVAHLAVMIPALGLLAALISAATELTKTSRRLLRWIEASSLGPGPEGSQIVSGSEVLLATTGLFRPKLLISAGALVNLSDRELRAGLAHERGHLRRGHRFFAAVSVTLRRSARLVPGSGRAFEWLHFHLERDADEYARRATRDPEGLASAIAAAAGAAPEPLPGLALGIADVSVAARIEALAEPRTWHPAAAGAATTVIAMTGITAIGAVAVVPILMLSGAVDAQLPLANLFTC
jgi:Zn-dependent protease with chaperone function